MDHDAAEVEPAGRIAGSPLGRSETDTGEREEDGLAEETSGWYSFIIFKHWINALWVEFHQQVVTWTRP